MTYFAATPSSELSQAIDKTWQRVIHLEVALRTEGIAQKLNKNQLVQCLKLIAEVRDRLSKMKTILESEVNISKTLESMHLPPFEPNEPLGNAILLRFIMERQQTAHRMLGFLSNYAQYLEDAVYNRARPIAMFRLSKIKKSFDELRQHTFQINSENDTLKQTLVQILQFYLPLERKHEALLDQDLKHFHQSIRTIQNAIVDLEKQVQQEKSQVSYMRQWLHQANEQIKGPRSQKAPTLQQIQRMNQSWNHVGLHYYQDCRNRLTIARDYMKHFVKQLQASPTEPSEWWPRLDKKARLRGQQS